jgi:hypothetical protein
MVANAASAGTVLSIAIYFTSTFMVGCVCCLPAADACLVPQAWC